MLLNIIIYALLVYIKYLNLFLYSMRKIKHFEKWHLQQRILVINNCF